MRIRKPFCGLCGKPLSEEAGNPLCPDCQKTGHRFFKGGAAFSYHSIQNTIYRLKYGGRAEYALWLGSEMAAGIRERFSPDEIDLILPVPLHAARLKKRGYNQAALLARAVGRNLKKPVREDVLFRVKATPALKEKGRGERQKILQDAFIVRGIVVKSKMIMLIDDVYTTGATIDACAAACLEEGAAGVCFFTSAIGESPS